MADGDLTRLIVTYTYICFSSRSTMSRPHGFNAGWNAPLPILFNAIPRLRCLPYTRLLSMHGPSTSELLRTRELLRTL